MECSLTTVSLAMSRGREGALLRDESPLHNTNSLHLS